MSEKPLPQLEPHRRKAERLGVSTRTLDRWVDAGIVDKPTYINGRKYHRPNTEPRRDDAAHAPEAAA
jgi:predicted site-specific integrase-resolvase